MNDDRWRSAWQSAVGGAFSIMGGRQKLKQYLNRVAGAAAIKDPTACETALGELRNALLTDLREEQITEDHYTIVLQHIDEASKDVRVRSVQETFQDLPFHVVEKLEEVLDDGVITPDEFEMIEKFLDHAVVPDVDKKKVLARLERWQFIDELGKP